MSDTAGRGLFGKTQDEYGENYSTHLFEQYKMLVDSAERVSDRRSSANNYLLTVNSSLITLFGLVWSLKCRTPVHIVVPIAGILVSVAWGILIVSYRRLNAAKFRLIHEFEELLPAAVFRYEWDIATQENHKPLSHVEVWIPAAFGAVCVALGLFAIFR